MSQIYASLKELVALQHQASGFSFLPRQPVHSILSGRHASRLRGRGLNFEEKSYGITVPVTTFAPWTGRSPIVLANHTYGFIPKRRKDQFYC